MQYTIEQKILGRYPSMNRWQNIAETESLTKAVNHFRDICLANPDTTFRMTAQAVKITTAKTTTGVRLV